jgi:hypothetical protein
MRRALFVAPWILAAVVAAACGDEEEAAVAPPADVPEAGDARPSEPIDAADAAPADLGCRTPKGPSPACAQSPSACERKTLYLSQTSTFPFAMVTDATNVYWVAQSGGDAAYDGAAAASVLRVSKSGEPTQAAVVLAVDQERTTTLVRDGEDLYWIASHATDAGSESTLRRLRAAAKAPGCPGCAPPEVVATFPGIGRRLVRVAPGVLFSVDHGGVVRRLTKDGGVTTSGETSASPSLAAGLDQVFAGGGLTAEVVRIGAAGGTAVPFVVLPEAGPDAALPGAWLLGADCSRVFGVRDEGAFWWSPAAGGYTATSETFAGATDIAADEGFVYVARRKGGGVVRGGRDGSGFTNLYAGDVARLAIDDEGVYWGEHAKGSLAGNVFMQTK